MTGETVEDLVAQLAKWDVATITEKGQIRLVGQGDGVFPRRPVLDVNDSLLRSWLAQARDGNPSDDDLLDLLAISLIESVTAEISEGGNTTTRVGLRRGPRGTVETYDDRDRDREYLEHLQGLPDTGLAWRAE